MSKTITKIALSVMVAIIGISAFAGTATASRSLSLNPGGTILAISLGRLTFNTTLAGSPIGVRCNVTLHGSMSRIAPKIANTLIGKINRVVSAPCDNAFGNTVFADTLVATPWKIRYQGITGTLPNPSAVQAFVEGAAFRLTITGLSTICLYEGNVPIALNLRGSAPNTNGLVTVRRHNVPLRRTEAGVCGANGELVGSFGITPTQTVILVN